MYRNGSSIKWFLYTAHNLSVRDYISNYLLSQPKWDSGSGRGTNGFVVLYTRGQRTCSWVFGWGTGCEFAPVLPFSALNAGP